MRRKIALVTVAAALSVALAGAPAVSATTSGRHTPSAATGKLTVRNYKEYLQTLGGDGDYATFNQGINPPDGVWNSVKVGVVSSSKSWPFTPGSGLNTQWNGRWVVQLQWEQNHQLAVSHCDANPLSACMVGSTSSTYWVLNTTKGTNNFQVLNVAITDAACASTGPPCDTYAMAYYGQNNPAAIDILGNPGQILTLESY